MFERFTDQARRVVVLAQEEARGLGHGSIGTEHILLGLIREDSGVGAQVLRSIPVSLEKARKDVMEIIGRREMSPTSDPPFSQRVKKVFELSLREALQLGHEYIGTEHILLGLIREGEGVGAQVLVKLGADLPTVRQRVIQVLHEGSARREPMTESQFERQSVRLTASARRETAADPAAMPLCPVCRASMEGNLRSRVVLASGDPGSSEARLLVVYCVKCGVAIETRLEHEAP
jgi:ATP-dependent Clp protease ATP-binding subunit ClpA